jgi:hypothetical protein
VVIKKGKKGKKIEPPAPGVKAPSTLVDPSRRILVMMNTPTKDRLDCIKISRCINARAEAKKYAYRIVAVYGSKGGDMSLHLDTKSSTNTMWNKNDAVVDGLRDAGIVGFSLERDWQRL